MTMLRSRAEKKLFLSGENIVGGMNSEVLTTRLSAIGFGKILRSLTCGDWHKNQTATRQKSARLHRISKGPKYINAFFWGESPLAGFVGSRKNVICPL